jgi:dienelactone hydrolase
MAELNEAGIPHGAEIYGGARHSFTVPGSNDYLADADADSWAGCWSFSTRRCDGREGARGLLVPRDP